MTGTAHLCSQFSSKVNICRWKPKQIGKTFYRLELMPHLYSKFKRNRTLMSHHSMLFVVRASFTIHCRVPECSHQCERSASNYACEERRGVPAMMNAKPQVPFRWHRYDPLENESTTNIDTRDLANTGAFLHSDLWQQSFISGTS